MALKLYCQGDCKKEMRPLEPFKVLNDLYLCLNCAGVSKKVDEAASSATYATATSFIDVMNADCKAAGWVKRNEWNQFDKTEGSDVWWNYKSYGSSRLVEILSDGNWKLWKWNTALPSLRPYQVALSGPPNLWPPNWKWIKDNC